ncbi:MAG: 3-methyladenine DNA glycosylase AlkC [Alteromonadaceae bacterium]|jgi:3-methyladenine DNA glycosylase AlkC
MELMKNGLSEPAIQRIAKAFSQVLPSFNTASFSKDVLVSYQDLELKERVNHIITQLHKQLPKDFVETVKVFEKIPAIWDKGNIDDPLRSFAAWPIIDYVGVYGLSHPHESLAILKQLTGLFSAEFAIRPLIKKYPDECHQQFLLWLKSENEDVRRLISEGTRPRLPWGMRLHQFIDNPNTNMPLLTHLKNDPSLYVRRSVANHLNDIAKDHPKLVIDVCTLWYKEANNELQWLIKHATRSLIKAGHAEVFPLLGFTESPQISVEKLSISNKVINMGETIAFEFKLLSKSNSQQKLVIDYAIHFVKANGKQQAKVFKLKNVNLANNEENRVTKQFSFKAISTRKYYPGEHKIEILINGLSMASVNFEVMQVK